MRGVQQDRIPVDAGRLHDGVAHEVGDIVGDGLSVDLRDEGSPFAVGKGDHVDL